MMHLSSASVSSAGKVPGRSPDYPGTIRASCLGYVVQAIVNSYLPLLFLTFQKQYGLSLSAITFLTTFNFGLQLLIDLLSAGFIDRIGYRASILLANVLAIIGLFSLTVLPELLPSPLAGIFLSIMIYAVGGGLMEVLISPIVESCPTKNKEATMSMLHSMYCWGVVAVVLLSTLFFHFFGIQNWKIMARLWIIVPALDFVLFTRVPIRHLIAEGERGLTFRELAGKSVFWLFFVMMLCAGASEQAVSQWASAFAESGLHVSKTMGDLLGPMMFSITMGISRSIFGKFGERLDLTKFMLVSAVLCIASYLLISLSGSAVLGLAGCALCGFSVGIFWPGTFSLASAGIKNGGTLMFALYALAGDIGCMSGPTITGQVAAASSGSLRIGIFSAIVFPLVMLAGILRIRRTLSKWPGPRSSQTSSGPF